MRKIVLAAALSLATAGSLAVAAPAMAQQEGLVNVTIDDVTVLNGFLNDVEIVALNDLLENANVVVQAPIGVAANVCNIQANVLAQAAPSAAGCTAESGSQALAQLVRRQLL